jgi:hypothetical protein
MIKLVNLLYLKFYNCISVISLDVINLNINCTLFGSNYTNLTIIYGEIDLLNGSFLATVRGQ